MADRTAARPAASDEARRALTALGEELTAAVRRSPTSADAAPGTGPESPATAPVEAAGAVVAGFDVPGQETVVTATGSTVTITAEELGDPSPTHPAEPVTAQTLFDLASVTKVVTTLTAATFIDEGLLDLDAPARELLGDRIPDARITARQLLTHSAGLAPTLPLWQGEGDRESRLDRIGQAPLRSEPGTAHAYSCIGFILTGLLLEQLGGAPLPELARTRVLEPAGASGAHWLPTAEEAPHCAATELDTANGRGMVQGVVHDETAWATGPVGNAGLFAPIADTLALGRALVGRSALSFSPAVWDLLRTDQLPASVAVDGPWHQAIGLRVGHDLPDGTMVHHLVGHTGFTGTSVLADPETGAVAVLLTNRVHPDRELHTMLRTRRRITALLTGAPTDDASGLSNGSAA